MLLPELAEAYPLAADGSSAGGAGRRSRRRWRCRPTASPRCEQGLATATGRQVQLRVRVDPAIVGGAVARIGSTVYDGSVTTQLERLKQQLVEAETGAV